MDPVTFGAQVVKALLSYSSSLSCFSLNHIINTSIVFSLLCASTMSIDYHSLVTQLRRAVLEGGWVLSTSALLTVYHYRYVFILFAFLIPQFFSARYKLLCHKTGRCPNQTVAFTALEKAGACRWQRYFRKRYTLCLVSAQHKGNFH